VVGPRGLAQGLVELKERRTGTKEDLPIDAALARFAKA
jgi:prolyl-tRNA synthetase